MRIVRVDNANEMYVIENEHGYSCLGFAVCERHIQNVGKWLKRQKIDIDLSAEIGTDIHYAKYLEVMARGASHNARTGQKCLAQLTPDFKSLEGRRIAAIFDDNLVIGTIGISTGWYPVHLFVENGDIGGMAIDATSFSQWEII